jgi:3-oxoacyl-[acyl-carrier protein] reductase
VTGRFGRFDILINDAACNKSIPFSDLDDLTLEVWDRIMAVDLTGPMRLIKAMAPVMKAQGQGRVVDIASVAGLTPAGSSMAYAVSKAGLVHLTQCMAVALAPSSTVSRPDFWRARGPHPICGRSKSSARRPGRS